MTAVENYGDQAHKVYAIGESDANPLNEYDTRMNRKIQKIPKVQLNLDGENFQWLFRNKYQDRILKRFARFSMLLK